MEETAEIAPAIKNGVGSSTSTLSANNSTSTDSHKSGGVRIDLEAITQENVGELRHLNLAIFPVRYHDKFYREVIHTPTQFTRFAVFNGIIVGAICCRVEACSPGVRRGGGGQAGGVGEAARAAAAAGRGAGGGTAMEGGVSGFADGAAREKLYLMTLGVLAAYRGRGIGSALLRMALDNLSLFPNVCEVYLHVQSSNEDAINFYERFGFVRGELVKGYYKRIEPPDCYVLRLPCNQQQPQQKHS